MNLETQPLDEVLKSLSLKNDDLVEASREQLTHKQVQKARRGRRVTSNIKGKIVRALNIVVKNNEDLPRTRGVNAVAENRKYTQKDLFDRPS